MGLLCASTTTHAQEEVTTHPNQQTLLESADPALKANKKLVYDFWVKVFLGRDAALAPDYVAESYIQHNPNVPTGRAPFIGFLKSLEKPDVAPTGIPDLVMITAERDIVILAFRQERKHPTNEGETYTTTWFDMFRIEDGKIAEHWDSAPLWK
ncbi:MAG: nuclear transport factor 2 family protein [Alphaproteobacteria bacterium]|nr:nuclear transport factor 2 family protein [Alphaproteobacteria bacterium]